MNHTLVCRLKHLGRKFSYTAVPHVVYINNAPTTTNILTCDDCKRQFPFSSFPPKKQEDILYQLINPPRA